MDMCKTERVLEAPWGWVLVNKAKGMHSSRVTARIKRLWGLTRGDKVGHGGTLDPLATGLLPIALGRATRLIPFLMTHPKTYEFTVKWGERTTTEDCEGEVCATSCVRPNEKEILDILPHFLGTISQIPPHYSAAKIQGTPAYTRARRGESFALTPRFIQIHALSLQSFHTDQACFSVTCGSGTYVRSLGRDLAHALHTEGHITTLHRTQVGPFTSGWGLDFFEERDYKERVAMMCLPESVLGGIQRHEVEVWEKEMLWKGGEVSTPILTDPIRVGQVWACFCQQSLVALTRVILDQNRGAMLRPFRCFGRYHE